MKSSVEVRKPAVAGSFYPANPVELSKMIAGFYAGAKKLAFSGHPIAIIAPHAGYEYSGRTAAAAYKQLEGEEYESVVVIAPSHTVFFQGGSVYDGSAYQTPIGVVEIDEELSKKIGSIHPLVYLSNKGHTGGSIRGEHSLEVQLPFLQQALGRFKLVAIIMGDQEENSCRALGEVLASALGEKNALIVASTDLSHFHPEKEARRLDACIQKAVEEYNPDKLLSILSSGKGEACGGGPVIATMIAAKKLGGEEVAITGYANSGETTGDYAEVVGYLSAMILSSRPIKKIQEISSGNDKKGGLELTKLEKEFLKRLAKEAIIAKLGNPAFDGIEGRSLETEPPESRTLREKRGAFVTIKIDGRLRGCIGLIRAAKPLYEVVAEMALAAAFDDPRFAPLTDKELSQIEIEISALSPLVRVENLEEIVVGRDGLMIRLDMHSGLLLPQVAAEHGWDKTAFLEQTCLKAGLPKNIYKDKSAEIYRFSAEVF